MTWQPSWVPFCACIHYNHVTISAMASQITSLTIVYSTVYSGTDQRKHRSSASLAFVRRIHRWLVNSPHKGLVTRKMLPFDDVIMQMTGCWQTIYHEVHTMIRNHWENLAPLFVRTTCVIYRLAVDLLRGESVHAILIDQTILPNI